jgi:hypothetical protein
MILYLDNIVLNCPFDDQRQPPNESRPGHKRIGGGTALATRRGARVVAVARKVMTTIEAKVPDYLAKLAAEVVEREKVSVNQIIALVLSAQVEAWRIRDNMEARDRRAKPKDFASLLDKVPDVPPMPGDELPEGYKPSQ